MKLNSQLRTDARCALDGKWGDMVLLTLLYYIIVGACSLPAKFLPAAQIISLLLLPMSWSYIVIFLSHYRKETTDFGNLFDGYKDFTRIFLTQLLMNVYIILWSLLLIIPGIIKSFSYALTPYILRDYPELKYNGAIELSMKMMEGHKMRLFLLYLNFIGWAILAIFTCGIGFLWLYPYMLTSSAAFYEDVKADYEGVKAESAAAQYVTDENLAYEK